MSFVHPVLALSLLTLIASTGCRSSDPLSGDWSNDTCFGADSMPSDIESCETTLTFTDALEFSLAAEWVSLPATADNPGCITTERVAGQSWSTMADADFDVLRINGTGDATVEREDCVNEEDDMDATATTDISVREGDVNYQISEGVLTVLTSELEGTYAP